MNLRQAIFGVILALTVSSVCPVFADDTFYFYDYYLNAGAAAFEKHDYALALEHFEQAHLLDPSAEKPLQFINLIKRRYDGQIRSVATPSQQSRPVDLDGRTRIISDALDQYSAGTSAAKPPAKTTLASSRSASLSGPKLIKKNVEVLTLDEILTSGQPKPAIRIEMNTSLIIEGKNIQKFLEIEPGFILVKSIDRDRIQIDAKRWGTAFLHIWDDRGRTTIYVEVILPKEAGIGASQQSALLEHSAPFRMSYALDNGSYYYGPDVAGLYRRTHSVQETVALTGDTPYGFLDTSLTVTGWAPVEDVTTGTLGLSNVPMPGMSDLDLRFFDAYRFTSPLTMPGPRLQGEFADVRLFADLVGVSVSHGRPLPAFNFLPGRFISTADSFIDAVQFSISPGSATHRYALNYAKGYGSERNASLTKEVYSIEGQQKVGSVDLNAELARDDRSNASVAGMKWANGGLKHGLSFRDISKDFTTISSVPSDQGEMGGAWTTNADWRRFSTDSFVDVYQSRTYPNVNDPEALNYDTNAHVKIPLGTKHSVDSSLRYVHTPGESSPRRHTSADTRLTRQLTLWNGLQGGLYAGAAYQRSRFSFSPQSEYDRYSVNSGIQLPLTKSLFGYLNYEYSWVNELYSAKTYNPAVMNTGLSYNKQISDKLSGTLGLTYRDEQNIGGSNSFLAGEDSLSVSAGLMFTPKSDVNMFCDTRYRTVWAQIPDGPSYNDLDLRFGVRMAWGLGVSWDPAGTISGVVFKDRDGNKVFNPDDKGLAADEGIPGVKVKIGDKTVVTDAHGRFRLGVRGKRVAVAPVLETVPVGFVFSTPSFVKVDVVQGCTKRVDFGLTSQAGIYGVVFVDNNGNGIPDLNDRFVGRVRLTLDGKTAQVADANGAYFFKNIPKGKHTLMIDMAALPTEYIPVVKVKNEIEVAEGTTYIFHIPLKIKDRSETQSDQK